MARHSLSKVVKKSGGKQKPVPVPVKIVADTAGMPQAANKRGIDKWEAQDALRTLQRAEEIKNNKALMRAAKAEANAQIKALSKVK